MRFLPRWRFIVTLACASCLWAHGFAQDIRQEVQPDIGAAHSSTDEAVLDANGVVYGLAFGASEDEVMRKFGKPTGYLRLDASRTALVYGQSHLLLCYDGRLDAVCIDNSVVDWSISHWITETAPFTAAGWRLSNGLKPGMSLAEVRKIVPLKPGSFGQRYVFSTDACVVQLSFFQYTDRGKGDGAFMLYGLLMTSQQDGKGRWNDQPPLIHPLGESMKGKKMLGLGLGASMRGVRITRISKNSPGDKAGLKPGDLITGIDGANTVGLSVAELTARLNAKDASTLQITSADGGKRDVRLTRADAAVFSNELIGPDREIWEVEEGGQAPDFEARSTEGQTVRLSGLKGSPVLVNFTATWCAPCKQETAALVDLYAKYKDRGLKVVSIYLDDAKHDVFAYAAGYGADWPIHTDGKVWGDAVARAYGVSGVPVNALIGKDGKILRIGVRAYEPDTGFHTHELEAAVEAALK